MQTCHKCGYARKLSDTAPDWQCPGCGIAYAKFGTAPHGHPNSFEPAVFSHAISQADRLQPVPAADGGPTGLPKNIIPLKDQIGHTLMAVFLLAYGTYGAAVDELIVPGKRTTLVLHGWSVWVLYAAMICAALVLLSVVVDNYDPRDDERYYHIFAHVFQVAGWSLFFVSVFGPLVVDSPPRELVRLKPLAANGDASAQYQIGRSYADGIGVHRDYAEALSWFRKAAEQGNAQAMNGIGILYFHGEGVVRNLDEAATWYRRAAEHGLARAQNNLGLMYLNLQIRPKDYEQGIEWLRKAAEQGYARALFNLGQAYEKGKGVEQDWVQAHMWYSLAEAAGFSYGAKYAKDLESDMTPRDIGQSQSLAREWQSTHRFSN